jgi:hypothetical protein
MQLIETKLQAGVSSDESVLRCRMYAIGLSDDEAFRRGVDRSLSIACSR